MESTVLAEILEIKKKKKRQEQGWSDGMVKGSLSEDATLSVGLNVVQV